MQGEIRVTVIATGFDKAIQSGLPAPSEQPPVLAKGSPVIPFPANRPARTGTIARPGSPSPDAGKSRQSGERNNGSQDLSDMEIPTFIRRQMD
jgi:cell division protein FtsZ